MALNYQKLKTDEISGGVSISHSMKIWRVYLSL